MSQSERRHNRSANTTRALCFQLSASLKRADLEGMVLADEEGVCLATAGDDHACDEIAAHLSLMGRKVGKFEGVLYGPDAQWDIHMKRFDVEGTNLYICAIGNGEVRNDQLQQSINGVARILMPA
ncbi:MAG: hypothetical protein GY811_25135 [Myxococcales bacterium]|nr:hypothetical protein [Myxococcales bacterium]